MACDAQYTIHFISTIFILCLRNNNEKKLYTSNIDAVLFFFGGWYEPTTDWIHDHWTHRHGGVACCDSFFLPYIGVVLTTESSRGSFTGSWVRMEQSSETFSWEVDIFPSSLLLPWLCLSSDHLPLEFVSTLRVPGCYLLTFVTIKLPLTKKHTVPSPACFWAHYIVPSFHSPVLSVLLVFIS